MEEQRFVEAPFHQRCSSALSFSTIANIVSLWPNMATA